MVLGPRPDSPAPAPPGVPVPLRSVCFTLLANRLASPLALLSQRREPGASHPSSTRLWKEVPVGSPVSACPGLPPGQNVDGRALPGGTQNRQGS